MTLEAPAQSDHPFTVTGEGGAILGWQNGVFELWQNPVKVLRDFHIQVRLKGYSALLEMNEMPATIQVTPEETIITLAHAGVVVREHLLVDRDKLLPLSSAVAYFEVIPTRPAEVTFSFYPVLHRQWPAPNFGVPSPSWRTVKNGSGYLLYTDRAGFLGAVTIPGATPGAESPYQERPCQSPVELHLHVDPVRDRGRIYPLLTAVHSGAAIDHPAEDAFLQRLMSEAAEVPKLRSANADYYRALAEHTLTLHSPDEEFNRAFQWAELSIDQMKEKYGNDVGLTAGWANSSGSDRPGFGWFFGRDTLWSLYAVNSYGDFSLTRHALDLLLHQQRADGKMMHELSQTADTVDWASLPYLYASADSTPLLLMQMEDFVHASGDLPYLKANWDHVKKAYAFLHAHKDHGLYSNEEGTGWVEEWPTKPHQEIYLAAVYVQSCEAMEQLAGWMQAPSLAKEAHEDALEGRKQLRSFEEKGLFAFSRNADGSFDRTPTIFPSVAWWRDSAGLPDAEPQFEAWADNKYSVDWGIRSVPSDSSIYDPISYHHGSVWPLYAGWVATAEFHAGHDLQALERVRQLLALYRIQDLGVTTEVLSGAFQEPLPRSSTHQLWSSAMTVTTVVRGVLGLEPDAMRHALLVHPHLPVSWNQVAIDHVRVGDVSYDVEMKRAGEHLLVTARSADATTLCLSAEELTAPCSQNASKEHEILLPLPAVEVDISMSLPGEGNESKAMRVLQQRSGKNFLSLKLEARAGAMQTMKLYRNLPEAHVAVEGAELSGDDVTVRFAPGQTVKEIKLRW